MKREMDEDINWGKLFLKVILAFVIILFIIWLVSKFILNKSTNSNNDGAFEKNLTKMYETAEKYFEDESKLPKDGKRTILTLKEMIDKDLIEDLKVGKTTCSTKEKNSYAKVTNKEGKYTLTVLLTCGSNSDYISKVFKDSSKEEREENKDTNKNNSQTNNSTNNNSTNNSTSTSTTNKENNNTTTQETEKVVVTDYTTMKYKFCKIENEKYYTVVYLNSNDIKVGTEITYTIQLNELNNISKAKISQNNYFKYRTQFNNYKNNLDKNFTIINGNSAKDIVQNLNNFIKASLKSNNFDYKLTEVYEKDGNYFVDIEITIKKINNKTDNYNGNNINYVPVYFEINYADLNNCVTDTYTNSNKYAEYYVIK